MRTPPRSVRLCLEPLEDRVVPSALPDIQMTYATTTDARTVSVNYTISGSDVTGQDLSFNVYRSSAYGSLDGARLIGTATLPGSDAADLGAGSHQGVKLSLTAPNGQPLSALTPDPSRPFVVVVANPNGTIAESNTGNNTASFETHVLGVIAHGAEFDLRSLLFNTAPAWETQMAAALKQDGYEAVIPFNWVRLSVLPFPLAVRVAGMELYQQVVAEADQLAGQHPGDVVDVQFIGHSRGAVLVSEVLQELVGTSDPSLRGGYLEMTLLDPHPASLAFGRFSWPQFVPQADPLVALTAAFELLARDPQVVVPPDVQQAQLFDQQTPAGQLGFRYPEEFFLNLWGDTAGMVLDESGQPVSEQNLTDVRTPGIGLIGHSEVHDWYLANVVQTNRTFANAG